MKRNTLLALLDSYATTNAAESNMVKETQDFVRNQPECFERSLQSGHVTASGWVISDNRDQVLLMHHRKLDRWFQPGGHCDGDPDVTAVARKEVEEETGLLDFRLAKAGIFDVDVHLIPANAREPAHYHYDIRFLFEADPGAQLAVNFESKDVKWVPLPQIQNLNDSESIMRMVRKTIAL